MILREIYNQTLRVFNISIKSKHIQTYMIYQIFCRKLKMFFQNKIHFTYFDRFLIILSKFSTIFFF